MITLSIAPPNSVLLVGDMEHSAIPVSMHNSVVSATGSCIAIGCRAQHDGPTSLRIGSDGDFTVADRLVFEGDLATPRRQFSLFSVLNEEIISIAVPRETTRLKIWVNDTSEPDRISILIQG